MVDGTRNKCRSLFWETANTPLRGRTGGESAVQKILQRKLRGSVEGGQWHGFSGPGLVIRI